MADNSTQASNTKMDNPETGEGLIGSQEAREEGLAYQMVSGVVDLDTQGDNNTTPARADKPDLGREPEYYQEEQSGGNPSGGPGGKAMDPHTVQHGDQP